MENTPFFHGLVSFFGICSHSKFLITSFFLLFRLTSLVSRLPDLTALVLMYLIRFLQLFAQSQIYQITKMDDSNLATVFAPNFLRCPSMDPMVIMESARKEMSFVKHLIQCLDTTIAEGIL